MRRPYLVIFCSLAVALVGCTSDREKLACDAAVSYLSHELANGHDDELVFSSSAHDPAFAPGQLPEAMRIEAFKEFAHEPWLAMTGTSIWEFEERGEVTLTPDEVQLLAKLFDTPKANNAVTQCPTFEAVLKERGISYGESAVKSVSAFENPEREEHAKAIAAVHLPIVSDEGGSAMLIVSRIWAPLAGVGYIVKIERQSDGAWLPTKAFMIWVA